MRLARLPHIEAVPCLVRLHVKVADAFLLLRTASLALATRRGDCQGQHQRLARRPRLGWHERHRRQGASLPDRTFEEHTTHALHRLQFDETSAKSKAEADKTSAKN